ncbi:MAG: hypothetical protein EAZ42_10220 [Verrucomicrobia bacterium]|nr:MAG: hypothetical protein EAZ42_10220 [Verrucomicrobiota bacterium]
MIEFAVLPTVRPNVAGIRPTVPGNPHEIRLALRQIKISDFKIKFMRQDSHENENRQVIPYAG